MMALLSAVAVFGKETGARWWPVQAVPKGVIRMTSQVPEPRAPFEMMVQSVAGLAAKAVNESKGDEMVWVSTSFGLWMRRLLKWR